MKNRFPFGLLLIAVAFLQPSNAVRHIVFIVADDLGWNDVGFHNKDMITPNIDKLATNGIILNSSYVQPVCTPSRHSFMTGVYPFKVGLQRGVIMPTLAECSPLNLKFLPQKLKALGYATHIVGKWHLGHCSWNCTPTYRGFDTFLGFYNGKEDYYTKKLGPGIDFRDGEKPAMSETYSSEVYSTRAVDIITNHDKNKPLFLYLPFQSVHSPVQVPKRYENMYPNINDKQRRQYCGMVTALDVAVGNITRALVDTGLMQDTLVIFTTDNGGMPNEGGNNYPLRGAKTTIFEGGTRAAAFVHGSGLNSSCYTYNGLMHAVDWHPTIVAAAGGKTTSDMDGINQWDAIRKGGKSPRTELVYNLDNDVHARQGHAAIRVGDYKFIQGYPGPFPDWYKPPEIYKDDVLPNTTHSEIGIDIFGEQLFDLRSDPTEHYDIAKEHPDIVKTMKEKLDEYRKMLVPPKNLTWDPASYPQNFGGYWSPGWCKM